ncbi:MAG: carbamoyl-phosphate synthase large subunit, partial [Pseudomonadota bacterium]|nr:carbamoyl-phosphate synthase large subunit [Pseudomonadota bacterium]
TYVEPITPETVKYIIEKESPDAILPTMGGQTALNTALALAKDGTLENLKVELIGANLEAIEKAEDRLLFREAMDRIGLESPLSHLVSSEEEGAKAIKDVGLPAILRPSFTLAGTGGGIAYNLDEFDEILRNALRLSPVGTVLIEESVLGWKEFEMEVVRDKNDNCIIVCSIENVDPMGIHTGDSITVAPALTLTDKEYQRMRTASLEVLREIGVDTGGSNVQFAVNPATGRLVVIEMNPRVSRSSALASKATGFPIAKIAAKLAVGYTLDELENDITNETPASFEPTIDYVVTKIPRFTFEKFPGAEATLTTSMKSVGEAMAIGRTFLESLQKALNSMETGLTGLDEIALPETAEPYPDKSALIARLSEPVPERLLRVAQALRIGLTVDEIYEACSIDRWFLRQIEFLINIEKNVLENGLPEQKEGIFQLKRLGFSDARLAKLANKTEKDIAELRKRFSVNPVFKRIDTCAAEFSANTPYMYSCYEGDGLNFAECEADPTTKDKIIILGGGPNRIGQGIEFDYCCVHAAYALSEIGYETIMVNCNPETVSTDYDTSDRLYFEPLTAESVINLIRVEETRGKVIGVIVQFGGQTPLKLSQALEKAGINILGTSPKAIDLAEDREQFKKLLNELNLKQPANGTVNSFEEAKLIAENIGYPVVIRPSYVLGGRAMEIVYEQEALSKYMEHAVAETGKNPILIDKFLSKAIEIDVDCISDQKNVYVAGIMEHIEEAGIHSGDSACSLPPQSLSKDLLIEVERQAKLLAHGLGVRGLMNVQFAIKDEEIFLLEVNPRASRTVPFVAKATGVPIAKIAARVMAGEPLDNFKLAKQELDHVAIKEAVFPFARFPGVDSILGPEMKSTG